MDKDDENNEEDIFNHQGDEDDVPKVRENGRIFEDQFQTIMD